MEIKVNNYRQNEILKFIRQNSNMTQEELARKEKLKNPKIGLKIMSKV